VKKSLIQDGEGLCANKEPEQALDIELNNMFDDASEKLDEILNNEYEVDIKNKL
jgi:hypothetical protein